MAIDHTNCTHPRTPAGRRACRNSSVTVPAVDYIGEHIRKTAANGAMKARMDREAANAARALEADRQRAIARMETRITGPVARRMARQAAAADMIKVQADLVGKIKRRQATEAALRIQPRRSGARVSARNTSCVQAALHIDAHGGKCACGWEASA